MIGAPDLDENQQHLLRVGAAMDKLALQICEKLDKDEVSMDVAVTLQALSVYWTGLLTVQTSANMLLKVQELEDEDKSPTVGGAPDGG